MPVRAASALSVQAAKLSNKAEVKSINDKNKRRKGLQGAAGLQLSRGASCSSQQPGKKRGQPLLKAAGASRHARCLLPGCLTRL